MSILDFFRKKSDREKYGALQKKVHKAKTAWSQASDRTYRGRSVLMRKGDEFGNNFSAVQNNYAHAKKKLDKLYDSQGEKAIKLNKQYDALTGKLGKDAEGVYDFEKKELGMHQKKKGGLDAITSIIGILGAIFFLSPIVTGNAIANLTNQTSNILGGGLFVIGIVGSYFWFKKR